MRTRYLKTSKLLCGVALCAMAINAITPIAAAAQAADPAAGEGNSNDGNTTTPIKHVIVIIGEQAAEILRQRHNLGVHEIDESTTQDLR